MVLLLKLGFETSNDIDICTRAESKPEMLYLW